MSVRIQEMLQDELSRGGVEFFFACPPAPHAGFAHAAFGFDRTEPLVGEKHRQAEAAM
jgi:hypothetical protein